MSIHGERRLIYAVRRTFCVVCEDTLGTQPCVLRTYVPRDPARNLPPINVDFYANQRQWPTAGEAMGARQTHIEEKSGRPAHVEGGADNG